MFPETFVPRFIFFALIDILQDSCKTLASFESSCKILARFESAHHYGQALGELAKPIFRISDYKISTLDSYVNHLSLFIFNTLLGC